MSSLFEPTFHLVSESDEFNIGILQLAHLPQYGIVVYTEKAGFCRRELCKVRVHCKDFYSPCACCFPRQMNDASNQQMHELCAQKQIKVLFLYKTDNRFKKYNYKQLYPGVEFRDLEAYWEILRKNHTRYDVALATAAILVQHSNYNMALFHVEAIPPT